MKEHGLSLPLRFQIVGGNMTKAELINALEGLPDDTEIHVPSRECSDVWVHAWYVQVDCDGSDGCQPEVTIVGTD